MYDDFVARRTEGKRVKFAWLGARMKQILQTEKPEGWETFSKNTSWSNGWCKRFNVSLRVKTNVKTQLPEERVAEVRKFHRTVRSFCMPSNPSEAQHPVYGRFAPENRFHVDQVPLCLDSKSEKTLERKGKP